MRGEGDRAEQAQGFAEAKAGEEGGVVSRTRPAKASSAPA
jgi:hypothetical protein